MLDAMGRQEWAERRAAIEEHVRSVLQPLPMTAYVECAERITHSQLPSDLFAWYLYLCHTYVNDPVNFEHSQGARVVPVFKAIGESQAALCKVPGIDERIARMARAHPDQPDSVLFEILVARAYLRDGWAVRFLPESQHRSPDLHLSKGSLELVAECKRKFKTSDYVRDERSRWLELYAPVRDYLKSSEQPVVIDIRFHKELSQYQTGFLGALLIPKLRLTVIPATIVDNEDVTVRVRWTEIRRCREHLRRNLVKMYSPPFLYLLFDFREADRGITSLGNFKTRETGRMTYVEDVDWAAAAIWSCDAPGAIENKTRSLYRQLLDAASQLSTSPKGAIHLGAEVYDGELLERARYESIGGTMERTPLTPNVQWVYFHLFAFGVPPDQNWEVEEKCHYFGRGDPALFLDSTMLLTKQ